MPVSKLFSHDAFGEPIKPRSSYTIIKGNSPLGQTLQGSTLLTLSRLIKQFEETKEPGDSDDS